MVTIIYQGPTTFYNNLNFSKKYETIFSTWNDEPWENISGIIKKGSSVVLNDKPIFAGFHNINLQTSSTISGIHNSNFNFILKVRSDIVIEDIDRFIDFLLTKNEMSFLAYHDHNGGYLCDYLNFGNKKDMLLWWDYQQTDDLAIAPEIQLLQNFLKIKNISNREYYQIKKHFNLFLKDLDDYNFNLFWLKMGLNFKEYLKSDSFRY